MAKPQTPGDFVEDSYWASQGVTTHTNDHLVQQRLQQQALLPKDRPAPIGRAAKVRAQSAETDFETGAANLSAFVVWGLVTYWGVKEVSLAWYWSAGVGVVAGFTVSKLLHGPLRFLLTMVKYALIVGVLAFVVHLFMRAE
jgi:hypothetical protein